MAYRVSRKSLVKEKFEYLRYILTNCANIFSTHKNLFIDHIHKRNLVKNCLEVFTTDFNKELKL